MTTPVGTPDTLRGAVPLTGVVVPEGSSVVGGSSGDSGLNDIGIRMAAATVRRMCNQHGCTGMECTHPNHRRDISYLRAMLLTSGLPGTYTKISPEERGRLIESLAVNSVDISVPSAELMGTLNDNKD